MSGKVFLASGRERYATSEEKAKSLITESPLISKAIPLTSTGTTQLLSIPAGAYVHKVGVLAVAAVAGVVLDVGDGNSADRYVDGLTTLAANDIAMSPIPGGAVGSDEVGGHYYPSADTIDAKVSTASSNGGTIRLLAWYSIYDGELPS